MLPARLRRHWPLLAALAAGLLLGRGGRREIVLYRRVEVPVKEIERVERVDTVVTWRERVLYRTVPAVQIALAPGGAAQDVGRFCAPTLARAIADTALPPEPPALLLRSVRTEAGWFWRADRVALTGPVSTGELWQGVYRVRPGWQAHVVGDSTLVQSPRWWWLREAVELGVPFALGVGVGVGVGLAR